MGLCVCCVLETAMQYQFLNTVTAHPHYVPLNLPVRLNYTPTTDIKGAMQTLMYGRPSQWVVVVIIG